jgi:hypothetical protein
MFKHPEQRYMLALIAVFIACVSWIVYSLNPTYDTRPHVWRVDGSVKTIEETLTRARKL